MISFQNPPSTPDFRYHIDLTSIEVDERIFDRGSDLFIQKRVHPNPVYPWLFMVSGVGSVAGTGVSLYRVDIQEKTCSCKWFEMRGTPCKHIVAVAFYVYSSRSHEVGQ